MGFNNDGNGGVVSTLFVSSSLDYWYKEWLVRRWVQARNWVLVLLEGVRPQQGRAGAGV